MDTWPFGAATNALEAMLVGTPVATCPSEALSGRFAIAAIRWIARSGIQLKSIPAGLIARNPHALPNAALKLARTVASLDPLAQSGARIALAEAARSAVRGECALHGWDRILKEQVRSAWMQKALQYVMPIENDGRVTTKLQSHPNADDGKSFGGFRARIIRKAATLSQRKNFVWIARGSAEAILQIPFSRISRDIKHNDSMHQWEADVGAALRVIAGTSSDQDISIV